MTISDEIVRAIRNLGRTKKPLDIANDLGVHKSTVGRVLKGLTYKHVT